MIDLMIVAFLMYLTILLAIGIIASRSYLLKSSADFIVGSRSVNWWVTAISAHAADMSDWLFMALPAAIYTTGFFSVWVAIGLVVGMFMSWHFLAPALRRATAHHKAATLTSYFETKFHETSGRISLLSALIMLFFFTIYIAAGIKGAMYVLNSTFGLSTYLAGALALLVTVSYSLLGGFLAAAWVDFFQGLFLLAAILITSITGYFFVGGSEAIYAAAQAHHVSLTFIPSFSGFIQILLDPIAWGLGYFGMPHILSKFMGARDVNQMYKSKYVGLTWQILALSGAILAGFVGLAFFPGVVANPEKVLFISMTQQLFPVFFAGLILCGILSATLSTMNAQMLVLAGVVSDDLYKKWYNPRATSADMVSVFRATIIIVSLLAFAIASYEQGTIFNLVQFAWGGLGASFGPLTLLSLYYSKINKTGAFWGILFGGATAIVWKLADLSLIGYKVNEVLPGFVIGTLAIVLISHFTKKK